MQFLKIERNYASPLYNGALAPIVAEVRHRTAYPERGTMRSVMVMAWAAEFVTTEITLAVHSERRKAIKSSSSPGVGSGLLASLDA